jgi:hypothetical protein
MEGYSRKHNLRSYFRNLISELVVAQPDDPLEYLIEKLGHKRSQRLFFLNFFLTDLAEEVGAFICNSFNFKLIKASDASKQAIKVTEKADFLAMDS